MPSFQLIRTDWPDFESAIRSAFVESTFMSARSRECRGPQLVTQSFRFDVRRRP